MRVTLILTAVATAMPTSSAFSQSLANLLQEGSWEGVTRCYGGQGGPLYPVQFQVDKEGARYVIRTSFEDPKYYATQERAHRVNHSDIQLLTANDRPRPSSKFVLRWNAHSVYLIAAPNTFAAGGLYTASCFPAVLVRTRHSTLLSSDEHNDFCSKVLKWMRRAAQTESRVISKMSSLPLTEYSVPTAILANQFSNLHFSEVFSRDFFEYNDSERGAFIFRIQDCARYSDASYQILINVKWLIDRNITSLWQNRYPYVGLITRDTMSFGDFEEPIPTDYVTQLLSLLDKIAIAQAKTREIDEAIDYLYSEPESDELEGKLIEFQNLYLPSLNLMEISYAEDILLQLRARYEMLQASRELASLFTLKEYPKLPAPSINGSIPAKNDEVLIPLTDTEILELEQPIYQDF